MPPRNAPLPNAVNLFHCAICDKGYPRQTDYENHLRSYDHNHRQRLAEMKKLTDANASDAQRPSKGPLDMRSIPVGDAANKAPGPRFKKVGGAGTSAAAVAGSTTTGGSRFKKVGLPASDAKGPEEQGRVAVAHQLQQENPPVLAPAVDATPAAPATGDVVMQSADNDEAVTWEEYDFAKPSECHHQACPGCVIPNDAVYEDGWLVTTSA